MQRTGAVYHEEAEERRYTVTYEGGMDADGPTDPVTLELPVLYVVWPCDKPFPQTWITRFFMMFFCRKPRQPARKRRTECRGLARFREHGY